MPSHLIVNSRDRQQGKASDFLIQIPPFRGTGRVALLHASIPNTLYNIHSKNHYLSWARNGVDYYLQIPHGAYGITDFVAMLAAQMNVIDSAGGYNCSYSQVTMKLTIESTDATFKLYTGDPIDHCWETIGFTQASDTLPALKQTGDSTIRLDFPAFLLLDIGLPGGDVITTDHHRANYMVPMANISQYIEIYNRAATFDQLQCYSLGAGVNCLRVRLMKPSGELCDLNGAEFSFVLGIEI